MMDFMCNSEEVLCQIEQNMDSMSASKDNNIADNVDSLKEKFASLRVILKYSFLENEALVRENQYLRNILRENE